MSKPRILFIHTLNSATTYYRLYQFLPYLRKELDVAFFDKWNPNLQTTCYWESDLPKNTKNIITLTHLINIAELIVIQKIHTPSGLALCEVIKSATKKPLLMEVDDLFTNVDSDSPAKAVFSPGSDLIYWPLEQMKISDGLIVSTPYLAKKFEKYNKKIYVVPNAIPLDKFNHNHKESKNIRIGWAGSSTHTNDLKIIKDIIPIILDKYENVNFYFWGGIPDFIKPNKRVRVDTKWVNIDKYFNRLQYLNFDIGLAPLRDSEFARGKSNLRWLEYSAMGIPTVASDVEAFRKTTALLCKTKEDWIKKLSKLIENKEYREAQGKKSLERVKKFYDIPVIAKKYIQILKKFLWGKYEIESLDKFIC